MAAQRPKLQVKTTIVGTLSQAYLRKLSRETSLATASTIFLVTFSLLWMVLQIGGQAPEGKTPLLAFFANIMYALTSAIGAVWCFRVAYRARWGPVRLEPRHQLAWFLIALALLFNAIGGAIYTYLEDYVMKNPVPSLADCFFMLFYFLVFAGLLLMPTAIKAGQSRLRIGLDAIITTLCILAFSWYFSIKPIFATTTDPAQLFVAAAYPFLDILLVLAIAYVLYQRIEPVLYPSLILFALGIVAQIWADTIYAITIPQGTYSTGTWYVDTFWFAGYLLIGLAGPYQYAAIVRSAFRDHLHSSIEPGREDYSLLNEPQSAHQRIVNLQMLLLYLPSFCLIGLFFYSELTRTNDLFFATIALSAGTLVVLHWLISNYENNALLKERDNRRAEAELLRRLTASLAEEIHMDSLLTRIVTIATTELGFDAATLLLIEDYDLPLNAQSSLLVRAAQAHIAETISLRLQGERLPQCTVLNGKRTEVVWSEHYRDIPGDISKWHRDQRLLSTMFIPLLYQGKILGSLGFSSRTRPDFDPREVYLATSFTDQAASAIERTHLYQEAREHELFAQALTAVAARLNAAITAEAGVGDELYDLICAEGARALQADYVILYMPHGSQLQAVASYANGQETNEGEQTWPPIMSYEVEVQALTLLQPTLIGIDPFTTSGHFPAVSGPLPAVSEVAGYTPATIAAVSVAGNQSKTGPLRAISGGLRSQRSPTLHAVLARRNVRSAILAPLIAGESAVALLVMARVAQQESSRRRSYISTDLSRAQDFAEQAAIAFTNARLYQQLRDAHRQLQEIDQLKDQFMVTASHELRTPLTAIQGYLELLAQFGPNLPLEQQQEFLQKARRGCEELVLLLSNVMDASRLEIESSIRPAHLQHVLVQEVISDVITLIEPQVKLDHRIIHCYIPDQLYVKADPARLRQVLLNLSSNALKYSPAGTPITYYARALPGGSSAIISVADKGAGIPPEDQAQLFQRFARLERDLNSSVRGSGLGLYISRRLIEAMNGSIWVESSGIPGAGSTFHIQLPLA
jgi:signal transduction histidine kinase